MSEREPQLADIDAAYEPETYELEDLKDLTLPVGPEDDEEDEDDDFDDDPLIR